MKQKIVFLAVFIGLFASFAAAQSATPPPQGLISDDLAQRMARERMAQENRERQQQQQDRLWAKARAEGIDPTTGEPIRDQKDPSKTSNPGLNEQDKLAIAVLPDDLKAYAAFLKKGRTGIVRLHNADICVPNSLVIHASAGCPNNVAGKATAYSFRAGNYRLPLFADIFFKGNKISTSGVFTIGVYSDLGTADINTLNASSEGIKELLDFEPPDKEDEIDRQSSILSRGVQIGSFVYGPTVTVNTESTYVLRSVAYKGKLLKGEKPKAVNVLASDERKDVTVIFKIVRQNSDGSIVLLWKELNRAAPPKVVLEAKRDKAPAPPKNEFTR